MVDDVERRKSVFRTAEERALIVAETYKPGATVAGVASMHAIVASQLSAWRTAARRKADRGECHVSDFASISVIEDALATPVESIEVVYGKVLIRLPKSTAPKRIADIVLCLEQST